MVGRISRTETHKGYRFDIGGHRFYTKVREVEDIWHEVMGDDYITVQGLSRIFYRNNFYGYLLRIFNALGNIGPYETYKTIGSFIKWTIQPKPQEDTFEEWVINRFGRRLCMHFFHSYTKKVWNAFSGAYHTVCLIEEFQYPRPGPGMMRKPC